jgi:hypothetical protein
MPNVLAVASGSMGRDVPADAPAPNGETSILTLASENLSASLIAIHAYAIR